MALDRKVDVLLDLAPDIAIVCECAEPERLRLRSKSSWMQGPPVWIGRNPHKGLAVFAFNGYAVRLAESYHPSLRYIAPVHIVGPTECNLLAVWAQNASAGGIRKHQLGPLRRGLSRYRGFLGERPAVIAGDLNSNTIWDKPGWRINHSTKVRHPRGEFRPGQRLSCRPRRGPRQGDRAHALLARPHQGRPDLSHRLCLPADGLDRQGKASERRHLRDLVRRGAERPCTGDRRVEV